MNNNMIPCPGDDGGFGPPPEEGKEGGADADADAGGFGDMFKEEVKDDTPTFAPFNKQGEPTFDTKGLSDQEIDAGRRLWFLISPDGKMPDRAPFEFGRPTFPTAGMSPRDIDMMRKTFNHYRNATDNKFFNEVNTQELV